jgi:hypothetical protein
MVRSPGTSFPSISRLKSLIGFTLPFATDLLWRSRYIPTDITLRAGKPWLAAHLQPETGLDAVGGIDIFYWI